MIRSWRLQNIGARFGPATVWAGCVGVVTALLAGSPRSGVVGFAEVEPIAIASVEAARVDRVHVVPGEAVEAGQLLVSLDTSGLRARRDVLVAQRLEGQAQQQTVGLESQAGVDRLRTRRAEVQTRRVSAEAELQALEAELVRQRALVDAGLRDAERLGALQLREAALRAEIQGLGRTESSLGTELQAARSLAATSVDGAPQPATDAELRWVEQRIEASALRAQVAGRVSAVTAPAGSVVPAGAPIVEVIGADTYRAVVCLSETEAASVEPGDRAHLAPRGTGVPIEGRVEAVGPLVAQHAPRCRTLSNFVTWGRAAYVRVPEPLVAGQIFDVTLVEPRWTASLPVLAGLAPWPF